MNKQVVVAGLMLAGQTVLAQVYPQQATIRQPVASGVVSQQKAVETIVASSTIEQKASVSYQAGQSITLQPGFTARAGAVFTASIAPVGSFTEPTIPGLFVRAFPNPFQDKTTIDYSLPAEGKVNHQLLDMQGQVIRQITGDEKEAAGQHYTQFDGANLPTGMYLYRIQVGKQSQTLRLLKKE